MTPNSPVERTNLPLRVLIVEDDPHDAMLLRTYLSRAGAAALEMRHVVSLSSAREVAATERLDIALVDLGLPDARHLDALHALREVAPDLPVIVVTGREDDGLAAEALYHGAEDYLTKSNFDQNILSRAIHYSIERHRGRRDLDALTRQLRDMNGRLESLLLIDPLTEQLNRRGLERSLSEAIERLLREGKPHLAFFVDLDHFKEINDRYGHDSGDAALVEVALKLAEAGRAGDAVGRVGGDEFVVIMPGAGAAEMPRIAERLRLAVSSACIGTRGTTLHVTACIAGIELTPEVPSMDVLLGRMHNLLQRSKSSGRNCVALEGFDDESPSASDSLFQNLRKGRGAFAVIQPIMNLSDLSVAGFEMLSRFRGSETMGPNTVFRMCAERNMLALADHYCLRTCIELSEALPRNFGRHVNIFPSTLMSTPVQQLIDLFPKANRSMFCIELSEQQMLGNTRRLQDRVEHLKEAGIRIACDDVGFGRSHLESLVLLEPDVIKLDKGCVTGVGSDPRGRRHLDRFVSIAHKLGATIVAEGVETWDDLNTLREAGVDQGQGFLWGMPGNELPIAV